MILKQRLLGCAPVLSLALGAWIVYKVAPSVVGYFAERKAEILVSRFDHEVQLDLAEVVEEELQAGEVVATVEAGVDRVRFRPRRAERIAFALAYAAYYEFGARDRNEAEVLITRKHMRDLLREHRNLRDRDAAMIIDRALYLSFLPSPTLREMNRLDQTVTFGARAAPVASWRAWYFPFGALGRRRHQAC